MRTLDDVFGRLATSPFRRRFRLAGRELSYLRERGLPVILEHGRRFVSERLAPESPAHDGKQTPFRGHPVFIAQHATACCCRGCLAKWHGIPAGQPLTPQEQAHVLAAIERWLRAQDSVSLPHDTGENRAFPLRQPAK